MDKEQFLLDTINEMIECSEPIYYKDFNYKAKQIENRLMDAEGLNDVIGITHIPEGGFGISTLSLIATITDCLINKRLAFCIETEDPNKGLITGVTFYKPPQEN